MKQIRWRFGALLLIAVGAALLVFGTLRLMMVDDRLQYALPMQPDEQAVTIATLSNKVEGVRDQLGDAASAVSMAGLVETLSVSNGQDGFDARILCVDEGWFDVEPVRIVWGRSLMETELARGSAVALIDESLGFKLFGEDIPEDAELEVGSTTVRVVGTVRLGTSFGVKAQHCVWMPLKALLSEDETGNAVSGLKLDAVTLEAHPAAGAGSRALFESTARSVWQSGGTFISTGKEAMRGTIVLRVLMLVLGFSVWGWLFGRVNDFASKQIAGYRELLAQRYFRHTLGRLAVIVLVCIAGYGLMLAAAYGLMRVAFYPLYTFTEWVPDDFTSWTSLTKVFWNLIGEHAVIVKAGSWELRQIQFFAGLVRWGALSLLMGVVVGRKRERR